MPQKTTAAKKSSKKKSAPKKQKSFEETLWDTATKLRASVEFSEYKHVVVSLIFLKFVSEKFEERRAELVSEGKDEDTVGRVYEYFLSEVPADTFFKDQHPDLKADYIMANPPFNLKDWRGYEILPTGPAWRGTNYAWILHMVSKLSDWSGATKRTRKGCPEGERGGANQNGFPLLHSPLSLLTSPAKGEGEIRQKLVDCMIAFNNASANTVPLAA